MDHGCLLCLTGAFDTAAHVLRCPKSQQLSKQIKADMVDSLLKRSPFAWAFIRHLWADDDKRIQEWARLSPGQIDKGTNVELTQHDSQETHC